MRFQTLVLENNKSLLLQQLGKLNLVAFSSVLEHFLILMLIPVWVIRVILNVALPHKQLFYRYLNVHYHKCNIPLHKIYGECFMSDIYEEKLNIEKYLYNTK